MTRRGGLLIAWIVLLFVAACKDKTNTESDRYYTPPLGAAFSVSDGEVTFFDLRNCEVLGVEQMEGWSLAAAFSGSGEYLAMTENRDGRVSMYGMPEFEILNHVAFGANPIDLVLSRSGLIVYVVSTNANFRRFTPDGDQIDTTGVGLDPRRMALRPPEDAEMWVACRGDSSVHIIDLYEFRVDRTLHFNAPPTDIRFTSLGSTAYVALQGSHGIEEHDASSGDLINTMPAGPGPIDLEVSANGRFIAASDSTLGTVRIWDMSAHTYWDIAVGGRAGRARMTQDSRSLFVISTTANHVLRVDLTGSEPHVADTITVAPTLRELALWESHP